MFLSEFDFKLTWASGSTNVADAPSRRPDFIPRLGDEHLDMQRHVLLTEHHTECLFDNQHPHSLPPPLSTNAHTSSISALTTISLENSNMLRKFQDAFQMDTEWCRAIADGDPKFQVQHNLIFHNG